MTSKWPSEGVCVVMLPSGRLGQVLLQTAQEWTSLRLIRPAFYIEVDAQDNQSFQPMSVTGPMNLKAQVVGQNGTRERSLFEELAENEISFLRVLAVRQVSKSNDFDAKQDQLVQRIREQLQLSASPFEEALSDVSSRGTKLLLVNLIMGNPGKAKGTNSDLIEQEWSLNVIVSPEDRSTPTGFDSFISENDDKYVGFLLANISTSLGLWTGVNRSVFDLSETDPSAVIDKVVLQRTFVRAVKTDEVALKVAAASLKQIENHGNPIDDPNFIVTGKSPLLAEEQRDTIEKFVQTTMQADSSALSCKMDKKQLDALTKQISLKDGLKLFFKFLLDNLIALPRNLLVAIIENFNKKATEMLFGPDGEYQVDLRKDLQESRGRLRKYGILLAEGEDLFKLDDVKMNVKSKYEAIPPTVAYRHDHSLLWKSIRNESINLLDGTSTLAPGKVLTKSESIIPERDELWQVPEFILEKEEDPDVVKSSLDWLDNEMATKLGFFFSESIEELKQEASSLITEQNLAEKERERARKWVRKVRTEIDKVSGQKEGLNKILVSLDYKDSNA